jgi:hypothetical protein
MTAAFAFAAARSLLARSLVVRVADAEEPELPEFIAAAAVPVTTGRVDGAGF